jgi:Tfp pilus assembly protein PilN
MLVEINLLPQKEQRSKGFILTLIGTGALFLVLVGFYVWQIQSKKADIANLDKQIEMTQKIAKAEQKNAQTNESAMSVSLLKNAVEWANSYPIQTIPVMRHLTGLLPERGFIQSFGYTEAGTVSLTVQFDSARESAYFLNSLNDSEWIDEAVLNSLNPEENEADSTENTVTTNQNSDEIVDASTGDKQSLLFTPDPNNPGSFIITPVDENELNNSGTTSGSSKKKQLENILPRYIGQFEINLNKDTIKQLISKGEGGKEGVSES